MELRLSCTKPSKYDWNDFRQHVFIKVTSNTDTVSKAETLLIKCDGYKIKSLMKSGIHVLHITITHWS